MKTIRIAKIRRRGGCAQRLALNALVQLTTDQLVVKKNIEKSIIPDRAQRRALAAPVAAPEGDGAAGPLGIRWHVEHFADRTLALSRPSRIRLPTEVPVKWMFRACLAAGKIEPHCPEIDRDGRAARTAAP